MTQTSPLHPSENGRLTGALESTRKNQPPHVRNVDTRERVKCGEMNDVPHTPWMLTFCLSITKFSFRKDHLVFDIEGVNRGPR